MCFDDLLHRFPQVLQAWVGLLLGDFGGLSGQGFMVWG